MNDLTKRQDAIDAVGEVHPLDYNAISTVERLKEIPSALQWIPVSERLPKYNKTVLISVKTENVEKVCMAEYHRRVKTPDVWIGYDNHSWFELGTRSYFYTDNKVIAWMPLPEPWKGEEDADSD